jgi:ABC-type glycerol-3-phosphate transport system substrate-binding protein
MNSSKIAIIAGFAIAVGAILFVVSKKKPSQQQTNPPATSAGSAEDGPKTRKDATEITFLYSTEKEDWIKAAVEQFEKANPDVKVTIEGKGSLEAAQAILDGTDKPTLWSPADEAVLNMLGDDWNKHTGSPLYGKGEDAPQPLVLTPLVFVIWQQQADVLEKASGGKITWDAIHKAVASPKGWPAIGGAADWGFVRLGHTDPTKSNSGIQALILMAYEYFKKDKLEVGDTLDQGFQTWVKEIEAGVPSFEPSTGTFMTDMVRYGPSKFHIAIAYENLAIAQLENAQGRWGQPLKVYYPPTTLWSDHPIALLGGDWVTPAQKAAARRFVTFLRSKPVQERAIVYGFRPADTSVPVKSDDPQNPWTKLAQYGVNVVVPNAGEVPAGDVVRSLMMMWQRVVKK